MDLESPSENLHAALLRVQLGDAPLSLCQKNITTGLGGKLRRETKLLCDGTAAFLISLPVGQSFEQARLASTSVSISGLRHFS